MKLQINGKVITWHCHLYTIWKSNINGAIGSSHKCLWSVTSEEWLTSATFIAFQDIDLTFNSSSNFHAFRLCEAHSSLKLILVDTSKQDTDVITSFSLVHLLVEGLNTDNSGWSRLSSDTNQMDVLVELGCSLFDGSSTYSTSTRNIN